MDIGIGLPNTLDITGTAIVDWARRAEERGFYAAGDDRPDRLSRSRLVDRARRRRRRHVPDRLFTDILLAPLYPPVWLAKATASLDAMSGGRLTLGVGVGGRPTTSPRWTGRSSGAGGSWTRRWTCCTAPGPARASTGDDFPVGPPPAGGNRVPVLIGGSATPRPADGAVRRRLDRRRRRRRTWPRRWSSKVRAGLARRRPRGRAADRRAGLLRTGRRRGVPRVAAQLLRFPGRVGRARSPSRRSARRRRARDIVQAFADIGVTEVVFVPTVASVDEVDRLADAVL